MTGWGILNKRRGPPSIQSSNKDDPGKDQIPNLDPASQDSTALDVGPEQATTTETPNLVPSWTTTITNHQQESTSQLPPQNEDLIKSVDVGPWGGGDGFDWDDGMYNGVREIIIYAGECIDSISVVYDKNGERVAPGKRGGDGGNKVEIKLQYPEEYLVYVGGYYGPFYFWDLYNPVIRSLEFRTNKGKKYGPYGVIAKDSKFFSLPIRNGRIVGFMGRGGILLDSIGFHIISHE